LPSAVTNLEISYLDLELKNSIITNSKIKQPAFIFPDTINLLTSLVRDPAYNQKYLSLEIFRNYFREDCHNPINRLENEGKIYEDSFNCGTDFDGGGISCPSPCSTISLGGNRTLEDYRSVPLDPLTEPWPTPIPSPLPESDRFISNLYFGDVVSLFFYKEMGLFTIISELIKHFDISGKYLFPNEGLTGIIFNKLCELMRKSEFPFVSSLQLESLFVRVLGWQSTNVNRKIDPSMITKNGGFVSDITRLIPQMRSYYSSLQVIDAVTQAQAVPPSETEIAIQPTLNSLKTSMNYFNFNNNWYLTLNAYVWLICGLSILEKSLGALGVPPSLHDSPVNYIPYAYDILITDNNNKSNIKTQNRFLKFKPLVTSLRKTFLELEYLDIIEDRKSRVFIAKNIPRILAFIDAYKSVYEIDLAAPQYRTEGVLKLPHEAI
jgi:hypothetical protein